MGEDQALSPWWRRCAIATIVVCFCVLGWLAKLTYSDAPPIPERVVGPNGAVLFTAADVAAGQQVFLRYGLMENGTIWGHGAYLGPDFSAQYLHTLAIDTEKSVTERHGFVMPAQLAPSQRLVVNAEVTRMLKRNRYDPVTKTLTFTEAEAASYQHQIALWTAYFTNPSQDAGLPRDYISDPAQLRELTSFFAWAAWASVANRPGLNYSYTNNFPYDPSAGNLPTSGAVLWSALSVITLLGATAAVLFAFGRFDFLGWRRQRGHVHPKMLPGVTTPSQRATIKYFAVIALLFLAQALVGGGTAHYRANSGSFYGINLSAILPSQILRTWHLQLAIFWISASYVAGGLFLAPVIGGAEPRAQTLWVNVLFVALVLVVVGSLLGEFAGVHQWFGRFWSWFGDQGWEYLDLGRAWQMMLAAGLVLWVVLLYRAIAPRLSGHESSELSWLFIAAAVTIPVFYVPAFFYNTATNFTIVDLWRFWIIHLWVENFLELFVTCAVAIIFYQLGIVSSTTAARVVYLDALLYLGAGIIGTGHHWYFTGQGQIAMALSSVFSAMEVVPLTLLTLDAWDFIALTRGRCDTCGEDISVPHRWTFYFLMAVGVWNFVGAGVFGFLINMPIVSYFEVGTMLTPNHAHAAFMGVFGMLAVALMVFAFRQVSSDEQWRDTEKYIRVSFVGLNLGLVLMIVTNLFPGGVLQLYDVLQNGYWHARSEAFGHSTLMHSLEWARLPGDLIFIVLGVAPLVIAALKTYANLRRGPAQSIKAQPEPVRAAS
ncbi:MAG: cbb3-type cytochrome c oxidase subunit I [Candidatus Binataceae bacterium]